MNDNDAKLTRVYTAVTGGTVQEDVPDQPDVSEPADPNFDLFVEAAAGNAVGTSGTPYTLTITAVNVTKQVVLPSPYSQVLTEAFDKAHGWGANGDDQVKTENFTLSVPVPGSAPNDLYRFYVSLVTPNLQIASFAESNLFMLV